VPAADDFAVADFEGPNIDIEIGSDEAEGPGGASGLV